MQRPFPVDGSPDSAVGVMAAADGQTNVIESEREAALRQWLTRTWQANQVRLGGLRKLPGGAIQENYALDAVIEGGPHAGEHALVMRTDAPTFVPGSASRADEFRVLEAVHAAGVAVPQPLALCEDDSIIGQSFCLMTRLPGTAAPTALLRDPALEHGGDALVAAIGAQMATLHQLRAPVAGLEFLDEPLPSPAERRVNELQLQVEALRAPQPVIEWGLRYLRRCAHPFAEVALCHRDLRIGNVLVDGGELVALLDWEFAALGDPHEDLGWFCARCWRHGRWQHEAGGVGTRDALYRGYESVSGQPVDDARVRYYELMAVVRWAVIALQQGQRHMSGLEPSLDLALTGRKVAEMEMEILQVIDALRAQS